MKALIVGAKDETPGIIPGELVMMVPDESGTQFIGVNSKKITNRAVVALIPDEIDVAQDFRNAFKKSKTLQGGGSIFYPDNQFQWMHEALEDRALGAVIRNTDLQAPY